MKAGAPPPLAEAFAVYVGFFHGFDLVGFDQWLEGLSDCPAKAELLERRAKAFDAFRTRPRDENGRRSLDPTQADDILRHLEWLALRRGMIERDDAVLPLAQSRAAQNARLAADAGKAAEEKRARSAVLDQYLVGLDQQIAQNAPKFSQEQRAAKMIREHGESLPAAIQTMKPASLAKRIRNARKRAD